MRTEDSLQDRGNPAFMSQDDIPTTSGPVFSGAVYKHPDPASSRFSSSPGAPRDVMSAGCA